MIQGLIILNSSFVGSRDLFWLDDPDPRVRGYNIYRAEDAARNWVKVNQYPVQGSRFRDQIQFGTEEYTFDLERDWVEKGSIGSYRLRAKGATFWSSAVAGRATLAAHPDDVILLINGIPVRPSRVIGSEGEIWLPMDPSLLRDGSGATYPSWSLEQSQTIKIQYQKLVNNVNLYLSTQTFYTVVPVDAVGGELHLPGSPGSEVRGIMDVDSMDYMQKRMVEYNAWIFEQVGEPSWLLIRKTKGDPCGCVNPETHEAKTACQICHETGFVGGYYGPLDFLFIDPDSEATVQLDEGGRKVERSSKSYLGPSPIIKSGDLIVRRNGERLIVGPVTYKSPRGVLLQQEYTAELLPPGSTRYLIPLYPEGPLPTFNPAFKDLPPKEGEPLSDPKTDPTKNWKNDVRPLGRTTTFGRIMT
jgi:hypothetical protein